MKKEASQSNTIYLSDNQYGKDISTKNYHNSTIGGKYILKEKISKRENLLKMIYISITNLIKRYS